MQPSGAPLATTRPEPLRRLFVPLPAVLSVSVWFSCSAATAPVPTVTVTPGATSRNAPSPAAIEFRSAPVSSNTSSPTSSAAGARFVQMTTVSTLLSLIAPGMSAASWAACPSLKVGSGVSWTPARTGAPPAATTTSNATSARRALIACRPPSRYGTLISGTVVKGGGGQVEQVAGSAIACTLSASSAVQRTFFDVPTTRPEPLLSAAVPLPAVLRVRVWSSWKTTVAAVPTVTVLPGPTLRNAPLPAWTELRSAPVSSKTSSPMSTATASTLVHTKSVSRLLPLITPTAV